MINLKYNKGVKLNKNLIFILMIFFVVLSFFIVLFIRNNIEKNKIKEENREYLYYKDKTIKINNVITIMNKAIESNRNNNIESNDKNEFIENDTDSIKVYIEIKSRESIIPMEALLLSENGGVQKVESLFSDMFFEYKTIEYHKKTGKIKKIVFIAVEDELEE